VTDFEVNLFGTIVALLAVLVTSFYQVVRACPLSPLAVNLDIDIDVLIGWHAVGRRVPEGAGSQLDAAAVLPSSSIGDHSAVRHSGV